MSSQDELNSYWLDAAEDRLCGREQAKAWALREVWRAEGKGDYGLYTFVASKVRKIRNGKPRSLALAFRWEVGEERGPVKF